MILKWICRHHVVMLNTCFTVKVCKTCFRFFFTEQMEMQDILLAQLVEKNTMNSSLFWIYEKSVFCIWLESNHSNCCLEWGWHNFQNRLNLDFLLAMVSLQFDRNAFSFDFFFNFCDSWIESNLHNRFLKLKGFCNAILYVLSMCFAISLKIFN